MNRESKALIFYLSFVGVIYAANYFIHMAFPASRPYDRIYYISGTCIAVVFLFGYLLYSWRSDLSEFLKRIFACIPFALMFSVFTKVLGAGIYHSAVAGIFISILLLLKTPNRKKHFLTIMVASCVFIIVARFYFGALEEFQERSFAEEGFIVLGFMVTLCFWLLYLSELSKQESTPNIKAILIRSVKSGVTISIFLGIYLVGSAIGDRLGLSLPVQLLVNTVIAVSFLLIGYRFDLLLIERKKTPKNSRISELHNELNDFYLNEREKLKR